LKKPTAILFLTLFLFNLAGYKCWYYYLQQRENNAFEASIDKDNYNEKDLITFKIPLSNPYQVSWKDFERVDGEINIHGVIYKYVKRKVEDGQLILLCLPYYKKMNLAKAFSEFGNHGNDLAASGKKSGNGFTWKSVSLSECEENIIPGMNKRPDAPIRLYTPFILSPLTACFIGLPGKPPELG